uniref:C-type lectin domain-containing protein n=1 Tax=Pundamilia nyererei TaxID=303518 RepID=A0A3B4FLI8_9CICH
GNYFMATIILPENISLRLPTSKCLFSNFTFLCFFSAVNYDFVQIVDQKYFVSNKHRGSFSEAVVFCSQRGLELALPQNAEENNALTQVHGKFRAKFKTDMKNQPLTFKNWGEGQPDKSIEDTGCTMLSENGSWQVTHECSLNFVIFYF